MLSRLVAIIFALFIGGQHASAFTLNFSGGWDYGWDTQTEAGFTFANSSAYNEGWLYLHDDAGVIFTRFTRDDRRRFDVHGADIWGYSKLYQSRTGPNPGGTGALEYLYGGEQMHLAKQPLYYAMTGYRDNTVVASLTQLIPAYDPGVGFSSINWGNVFTDLDSLEMRLMLPADRLRNAAVWPGFPDGSTRSLPYAPGEYVCEEWCGGFRLDNLRGALGAESPTAIVPVPPMAVPMALALVVASGLGLRRRSKSTG